MSLGLVTHFTRRPADIDSAKVEGTPPDQPRLNYEIQVPPEQEGGRYANFLSVWHTQHEFTLDFAVLQPTVLPADEPPPEEVTVPAKVVTRVRVPPTLLFSILQALNANLTRYEEKFGPIHRLEEEQE